MSPTYEPERLERIAAAVGLQVEDLSSFREWFEAAAIWFRLGNKTPRRITPSALQRRLHAVSGNAKRLLKALGVEEPSQAMDGPNDRAVMEVLITHDGQTEEEVIAAAVQVARLTEILAIIEATSNLYKWSIEATHRAVPIRKSTTLEGHTGDLAANEWIASMMELYEALTGRPAVTSTAHPTQPNRGEATGPLIRFLTEAQVPIGLNLTADALAARVKTIRKHASAQN